jgi:glycosyltransferase involved in cell wall biosynthesis
MTKIMFVISTVNFGGAEKVVRHLVNSLDKTRFDVHFVSFLPCSEPYKYLSNDLHFYCLDKKRAMDIFSCVAKLSKLIKSIKPDVVCSFLNQPNIATYAATKISGCRGSLCFVPAIRSNPWAPAKYVKFPILEEKLLKIVYRNANYVTSNSSKIIQLLESRYKLDRDRLFHTPNPIDIQKTEINSREKIEHNYFESGYDVILGVGRLTYDKRFDRLIRIFNKIGERRQNLRLILVGEGEERERLSRLISGFGMDDRISLVGRQQNVPAWMRKSKVVCISSDNEGFPNVLLEAMALQVPVVSTNCNFGPNEIIRSGHNGILVDRDDEEGFGNAILDIVSNPLMGDVLAKNAYYDVQARVPKKIIRQYENFIMSIVGGNNGRS